MKTSRPSWWDRNRELLAIAVMVLLALSIPNLI